MHSVKTGILLHVYHLGSRDWERLVWGDPARDMLGTGAKLIEYLLTYPDEDTAIVFYSGPSTRGNLSEGAYTKQFLLANLTELSAFPRFQNKLKQPSYPARTGLGQRLENIVLGEEIQNTEQEIVRAAAYFQDLQVEHIVHIAAASHAPRCIQLQASARERGAIPPVQQWFTMASDVGFAGHQASDTVVIEPPHRADDPLLAVQPTLAGTIKPFFSLPFSGQSAFIVQAAAAMKRIRNSAEKRHTLLQ